MKFPGFVGPAYTLSSLNAAAQRCVNFYPEIVEVEEEKRIILQPTPGLELFATLPAGPVRGMYALNGHLYAAGGGTMCEVSSVGVVTNYGAIENDNRPVSMAGNTTQLAIASAGAGYILAGTLSPITSAGFPGATHVVFLDGYFISLDPDSQQFRISGLYDGTTWDALDFASAEGAPDKAIAMMADHRELWVFGSQSIEGFYNSGNADFPLSRIGGSFVEHSCAASRSPAKLDNSIYWLDGGPEGAGMVYRLEGRPVRVSTHAIETAIQGYTRIDDAIGFAYQDQGHSFYVLNFPTGQATWVYDAASNLWHERAYWNQATASFEAHRGQCHAYAFGKHLVGDRTTGNIYALKHDVYTDNGDTIRRVRRAPHIGAENHRLFYSLFEPHFEAGAALPSGLGSDPQCMLRWSNDAGHTFGSERQAAAGKLGQYTRRAQFWRLGSGLDRVFELSVTDPIRWVLLDAYLKVR